MSSCISKILSSNHTAFIKIVSDYLSISAAEDAGVNAVAPLVRPSIFLMCCTCLVFLQEFAHVQIILFFILPVSFSLGLGRLSLGNQVGQKAVSRLERGTVCQ